METSPVGEGSRISRAVSPAVTGRPIPLEDHNITEPDNIGQEIAAFAPDGSLAAILVPRGDRWGPSKNFVAK